MVEILEQGGAVAAIENGFIENELARSAFRDHEEIQSGRRLIVGVNFKPRAAEDGLAPSFILGSSIASDAVAELRRVKACRDGARVERALAAVRDAAQRGVNTIPALIEAARARASLGEMTETLASVFGRHVSSIERGIVSVPRGEGVAASLGSAP